MIYFYDIKFCYTKGIHIKFIILIFTSSIIFANQYPCFTQEELSKIAKKSYITKNRIVDYTKRMSQLKSKNNDRQLKELNLYLNQLLPQYDAITQDAEDYWETPKEFLKIGYGDCEDYVIIKYYSLIKLGFDEKKLFITVVKEKFTGSYHMVLSYFKTPQESPLVLDNLSFRILTLDKRSDLHAELFINSSGVHTLGEYNTLKLIQKSYKAFETLQKKVAQNL